MRGWFRDACENGLQKAGYIAIDTVAMAIAYLMATLFRYDFQEPLYGGWSVVVTAFGVVWAVQLFFLCLFGCYRMLWRFISVSDLPRFVGALFSATLVLAVTRYLFPELRWLRPPYGVTLMNGFIALGAVLAVRLLGRIILEGGFAWRFQGGGDRVLLIGAGNAGNLVARELQHLGKRMPRVVGFLDDDAAKQGASILGFRVLGRISDLREIVRKRQVNQVIVTMTRVSREVLRQIVKDGEELGVPVRIIPEYANALAGKVVVSQIRQVEVSDLLGRVESAVDSRAEVALLGHKRVMVTGAGGSIGSELVRQIVQCGPEMILLVERSEFALYAIDRELRMSGTAVTVIPLMADIGDEARMRSIFERYAPQIVIHAAAHKHVPMMERNPGEAVKDTLVFRHSAVLRATLKDVGAKYRLTAGRLEAAGAWKGQNGTFYGL
ncbi:MAG: polysaccharide biosynthesis protein, partial [Kiritimatiellae bacterium]|nr:polysaccharide biosynthesis protein [Kiritimatiellia bacterium]